MDDEPEEIIIDTEILARNKRNMRILWAQNMYGRAVHNDPSYRDRVSFQEVLQSQEYGGSAFHRRWNAAFRTLDDTSHDSQLALLFNETGLLLLTDDPENDEKYVKYMRERMLTGTIDKPFTIESK